jgi:hypothetical protein
MLNAIRDSLSNVTISEDEEDGEDEDHDDENPGLGQMSQDEEPGWVMDAMTKTVKHHMEIIRPKQMKLDKLMQLG